MTSELLARVAAAAAHWKLTLGEPLTGGTSSAVHAARDSRGRPLVLKLPSSTARTAAETAALSVWDGTGASATLVDATADALLLEFATPGTILPWRLPEPRPEILSIAAVLLGRLWDARPGRYPFPTLAETDPEDERIARADAAYEQRERGEPERGVPGVMLLPAAAKAADALLSTAPEPVLLHGDFITKNLIRSDAAPERYIAIDPLPRLGDPAFDVAAFAAYQPAELILPVAAELAALAGVPSDRALRWAAVGTVRQAAQAWREDQAALERLVQSAVIRDLLRP